MKVHTASTPNRQDMFMLSPGEIHFLWWFIQGSIMNPSTRERLRNSWGMCERHAWGWMVVEAAFRSGYMHGPAVLYEDLMGIASSALQVRGPMQGARLKKRFRQKSPCLMCEEGYGPESKGFIKPDLVAQGRDLSQLRRFAARTRLHWQKHVCGICANTGSRQRCRKHFIEEETGSANDFSVANELVRDIFSHLEKYARSFQFEFHGTHTDEDMAALISAVGWCSGWRVFLTFVDTLVLL